ACVPIEGGDQSGRTQALQRACAGASRHYKSLPRLPLLQQQRDVLPRRPRVRGDERLATFVHGYAEETLVEQALGLGERAQCVVNAIELLIRERLADDCTPDRIRRCGRLSQLAQ